MEKQTVIIDLGVANYGSMINMLKRVGASPKLSSDPDDIVAADYLVLPGVGAFDAVVSALRARPDIMEAIDTAVFKKKTPFMGVCVGMQLLFEGSEEGNLPGLGWFEGTLKKFNFPDNKSLRVPHMGWNKVRVAKNNPLLSQEDEHKFYFVHSYFVKETSNQDILTSTTYGTDFISAVNKDNIFGFQFHPEKSHKYGIQLFKNFVGLR